MGGKARDLLVACLVVAVAVPAAPATASGWYRGDWIAIRAQPTDPDPDGGERRREDRRRYQPPPADASREDDARCDTYRCPPRDRTDGDGRDGGGGIGTAGIAAIAGIFGAATLAAIFGGSGWQSADKLDEEGPRLPSMERIGRFEVQGYVRGGWPVVLEVVAQPASTTWLEVIVKGERDGLIPPFVLREAAGPPWERRVQPVTGDVRPTSRGELAVFALPQMRQLEGLKQARLRVFSVVRGDDGRLQPSPLKVLAVGCGPDVVGSAAVTIERFGPTPLSRATLAARHARYSVMFRRPDRQFTLVRGELVRRDRTGDGFERRIVSKADLTERQLAGARRPYAIDDGWPPSRDVRFDPGEYDMQIRINLRRGPWIAAYAPTPLMIE